MRRIEAVPQGFYLPHLRFPDLLMNLAEGLLVGCADESANGLRVSSHVTLNERRHIHLLKQDKVLAASPIRVQGFVLIHRVCHTSDDERCERQRFSGPGLVLPQERARPGHIDFEQVMNHGRALG